mmetsp:Transcript_17211/g.2845  ORF Transcript_17211/g.2845 Transcript_17211/m.2845 type:complete len:217 (-) Transcript_17211:31-681(-)
MIKERERSLVANIAAANNFNIEHLRTNFSQVENATFYYISGFFLTVSPPSMLEVAQHALQNNKRFSLNLGALFLIEFFKDPMMQVFPYCDYIFGNEDEAAKFAEVHGLNNSNMEEIAQQMANLPKEGTNPRTVVITQGKNNTVVATPTEVRTFAVNPIEESRIIDTNGAGDAFVGGFLAMLLKGNDLEKCVNGGHYAAGEIIQRSGCVFPSEPAFE